MQTTIPLYGFGGGGGTGASLTVNAPAGCTVTVSKDGKTKTRTAGADGTAVFKGLSTGTWTVTITDGSQTAQKTVTITADYSTAITFFSATIHVTYPAGATCTATDGVTTLTAPDTSGTWDCVVPNAGTWTVSVSDKGWTESVEITGNNQSAQVDISKYYLYRNGNEYVSRTGGWITNNYVNGQYTAGTLNRNADNMEMIASSSDNKNVILRTTQKINLTNIKELTINVISRSGMGNVSDYIGAYLYIKNSALNGEYPGKQIAFVGLSGTGLFSVDVSAITGEYYVIVSCYGASIQFNQVGAAV